MLRVGDLNPSRVLSCTVRRGLIPESHIFLRVGDLNRISRGKLYSASGIDCPKSHVDVVLRVGDLYPKSRLMLQCVVVRSEL